MGRDVLFGLKAIAFKHHYPETRAERLYDPAVATQTGAKYACFSFCQILIYHPFLHSILLRMQGPGLGKKGPQFWTGTSTSIRICNICRFDRDLLVLFPCPNVQSAVRGSPSIAGAAFIPTPIAQT